MTDAALAIRNLGMKAWRRLRAAHKPVVRMARRRARAGEREAALGDVAALERELEAIAAGRGPIVAGPWLAEVGYEALYWVPFLRWFADAYRIPRERLVVLSRGGVADWYEDFAGRYVDLFDLMEPGELARRNDARQREAEAGGRKQTTGPTPLDEEMLGRARSAIGLGAAATCHPSMLFGLFRHVWYGTLPHDFLWTHTRYRRVALPTALPPDVPAEFTAVKFYSGTALPTQGRVREQLRALVERAARVRPVVVLDTGVTMDEHQDFDFAGIPNVVSAARWMTPANNLGLQSALVGKSRLFLSTCGGLGWLGPFLGTPTVAAYADDRLLGPHLYVARLAGRRVGAADFVPLDLRADPLLDA
ncbi:MAG: hypothetical protein AB7P99_02205 [Vicinamibacterales bacterium]